MAKKEKNYSFLINILFILIFVSVGLIFYLMLGKNGISDAVKNTEKSIQNKMEQPKIQPPVQPEQKEKISLPPFTDYKFLYKYSLNIKGHIKQLKTTILVPVDEKERQYISNLELPFKPTKLYNDGLNLVAEFDFENISNQTIDLIIKGNAKLRTYDIKMAKLYNKNLNPENPNNLNRYLKSELKIESDDSYIKNIASKIKGSTQEEIVQNIYEYTQKNMNYKIIPGAIGAKRALMQKEGKCSEYAAIMTALCRAKNIPARVVIGNIAREQNTPHEWVEVYYDKYGWVTYDPTVLATTLTIKDQHGNVIRKEKRYDTSHNMRYISSGRNIFNMFHTNYSTSERSNGTARVTETISIQKI